MAQITNTQQVVCPHCSATGILLVWSCGCRSFSVSGPYGGHNKSECQGYHQNFFTTFDVGQNCGQTGDVWDHKESGLRKLND